MPFECKFCLKEFKYEKTFLNHECREMIRHDQLRSSEGLAGYSLYGKWMEHCNRTVPSIETFATSRFYNAFIKFGNFIKKVKLPNVDRYIAIMSLHDISPILWNRDECYAMYLEWYDRVSDPYDQVQSSIDTLDKVAEIYEVELSEVFNHIDPKEILQFIRLRRLSPWLLLSSSKFKNKLKSFPTDDKGEFESVISYSYWAEKFVKSPDIVKEVRLIAKELGI